MLPGEHFRIRQLFPEPGLCAHPLVPGNVFPAIFVCVNLDTLNENMPGPGARDGHHLMVPVVQALYRERGKRYSTVLCQDSTELSNPVNLRNCIKYINFKDL